MQSKSSHRWKVALAWRVATLARSFERINVAARRLVRRVVPTEPQRMFALTLVTGVACGLVAVAFHLAIRGVSRLAIDRAETAAGYSWIPWMIATPAVGGLIAGLLLHYVVPNARGSGVPQVKAAYALGEGRIRFRDAVGKFALSSVQIGMGASLGREGPTVQICAGVASLLGRMAGLSGKSLRRMMPVGVAAGIAAAFNAPIAAVTFTIEEVVGTLDQTVLSGVVVAAAFAAVIEHGVLGEHPIFNLPRVYGLHHPSALLFYAGLGGAAAVVSVLFTDSLLRLRLAFSRARWAAPWARPAVGGLVTGVVAVAVLAGVNSHGVTGGGYDTLVKALGGALPVNVLLALCAAKLVATVFSYGSGGAGGIFAPALFLGGMLGGAVGHLDIAAFHHSPEEAGAFALVGMGATFAGIIRVPITSVLIIFEMTGGYGLVLPLMIANMISYGLARHWRPIPIYEALLKQDGIILAPGLSEIARAVDQLRVESAMTPDPITLAVSQDVAAAQLVASPHEFSSLPVVDATGRFLGLVRRARLDEEVRSGRGSGALRPLLEPRLVVHADEPLVDAIVLMHRRRVRQVAVTTRGDGNRVLGVLTLSDVVRTHARAALDARGTEVTGDASVANASADA